MKPFPRQMGAARRFASLTSQRNFSSSSAAGAVLTASKNHPDHNNDSNPDDSGLPRIFSTAGVPIHLYAYEIEPLALEQVRVLAESPIPVDFVAVMPDAHLGVRSGTTCSCVYVFASDVFFSRHCMQCWTPVNVLNVSDFRKA